MTVRHLLLAALTVVAAAAPAAAQAPAQPASCDVVAQNLYVRDVLDEIYFWYREIPAVDAARFASPGAEM